jgi:multiple sugar transport system ATP-binding protein
MEELRKMYDDVVAVHGASFEVHDGEFVVLVGPSGCGKSTTLRMIAGLETITSGRLLIGDREVTHAPPKDRNIAMVFQNYALYPHMSAYENMAFGLRIRKLDESTIDKRVREAADILSITPILDRKPKALSGGQRQRVAVGRAIVRKPQVFLFDEPLSNLDAKLRVQMRTEISKLHSQLSATMIYVTHDQTEAMTMGDRIVVLHDGHVQQIDAPLDVYNYPTNRFVAGFIGSPSMNIIEGELTRSEGLVFRAQGGAFSLALPDALAPDIDQPLPAPLTLGIRPEDLYVASGTPASGTPTSGTPSSAAPGDASPGQHGTSAGPFAEARFRLDVVEPMGNEIIIYVRAEALDDPIVGRITPQALSDPGTSIDIAFDLSKLHFFDAETGQSLTARQAATAQ